MGERTAKINRIEWMEQTLSEDKKVRVQCQVVTASCHFQWPCISDVQISYSPVCAHFARFYCLVNFDFYYFFFLCKEGNPPVSLVFMVTPSTLCRVLMGSHLSLSAVVMWHACDAKPQAWVHIGTLLNASDKELFWWSGVSRATEDTCEPPLSSCQRSCSLISDMQALSRWLPGDHMGFLFIEWLHDVNMTGQVILSTNIYVQGNL